MELLERQKNKVLNYKIAENIENTFWFDLTLGIFKYGTILRKRPVCPGVPVNRLVPVSRRPGRNFRPGTPLILGPNFWKIIFGNIFDHKEDTLEIF